MAGLVGVLLMLANRFLPAGPGLVASLAAVPLSVAYWCGRAGAATPSRGRALLGGMLGAFAIMVLVVFYYTTLWIIGQTESWRSILFFGLAGVVGGAFAGGLAAINDTRQELGAAFLGSLYIGEALFFRTMWPTPWVLLYAGIGLISIMLAAPAFRTSFVALVLCLPGVAIVFFIWSKVPGIRGGLF